MFDIGSFEIILILVMGLIILGPKELKKLARFVGNTIRKIKGGIAEVQEEVRVEMDKADLGGIMDDVKSEGNKLKDEISSAGSDVRNELGGVKDDMEDEIEDAKDSFDGFDAALDDYKSPPKL